MKLIRIIMHWTAGAYKVSGLDKEHYHIITDGDGNNVSGDHAPEDNMSNAGGYAAHTRHANTGSIGVSMAAMAGATEKDPGDYPIKEGQLDSFIRMVAGLADKYDIPITPTTVLSHGEVQPRLGIAQLGKWDIGWLPSIGFGSPLVLGDELRRRIAQVPSGSLIVPLGVIPGNGSPRPVLDRGDYGDNVRELQRLLGVTADGDFGPNTEKAVKAYQARYGLTADGIVGKNTWKVLLA